MKIAPLLLPPLLTAVLLVVPALPEEAGHEGHDHDASGPAASPHGGRIITAVEPHLEFFVTESRTVKITALDDHNQPVPLTGQTVRLTGGDRANPTRMTFTEQDGALVSDIAFPAGNDFPVVLQIKLTPTGKTVLEKFNLNLTPCPTCKYQEYACVCSHGEVGEEAHDEHEGHHH